MSVFPENKENLVHVTVNPLKILDLIKYTSFSVSSERYVGKYSLNGVLFEFENDKLCAVSTDGKRLSQYTINVNTNVSDPVKIIIPIKTIKVLNYIVEGDKEVTIFANNSTVSFVCNNIVLTSRLYDGDYPNYKAVIPTGYNKKITINRKQFIDSLNLSEVVFNSTKANKSIDLNTENNKMIVKSMLANVGEFKIINDVVYDKEKYVIRFNPDFLIEVCSLIGSEKIDFHIGENNKPLILKEENFVHVLMPIRVENESV
jgi:DNA polymerase III subunit beta